MPLTNRKNLMQVRQALAGFRPTHITCSPATELCKPANMRTPPPPPANQFPLHTAKSTAQNPDNQSTESDSDDDSLVSSPVSDALLEKIERIKKIRIAPIKRPRRVSLVVMVSNKDDEDSHDTGGSGTRNGTEESDMLEAKLEVKISGTSSELWTRLEKVGLSGQPLVTEDSITLSVLCFRL